MDESFRMRRHKGGKAGGTLMPRNFVMQLRYVGVFPKTGLREYKFNINEEDIDGRQVVLTIEDRLFATRLLLFQEAPDLCYQKLLLALHNENKKTPIGARTMVTASDVAFYRDTHPNTRLRKHVSTGWAQRTHHDSGVQTKKQVWGSHSTLR
jgi:hypothetical protein